MTAPTPEQAAEYLASFIADALSRLRPGEEAGAWWEIGWCWWDAVKGHPEYDEGETVTASGLVVGVYPKLRGLPFKFVYGDQIRLVLAPARNPYDCPRDVADPTLTLADVPLAICYERRGEVRAIVVMRQGIEDSPVNAVLPRAPILLPNVSVEHAGRMFAGYFRHDLAEAMRNEA